MNTYALSKDSIFEQKPNTVWKGYKIMSRWRIPEYKTATDLNYVFSQDNPVSPNFFFFFFSLFLFLMKTVSLGD